MVEHTPPESQFHGSYPAPTDNRPRRGIRLVRPMTPPMLPEPHQLLPTALILTAFLMQNALLPLGRLLRSKLEGAACRRAMGVWLAASLCLLPWYLVAEVGGPRSHGLIGAILGVFCFTVVLRLPFDDLLRLDHIRSEASDSYLAEDAESMLNAFGRLRYLLGIWAVLAAFPVLGLGYLVALGYAVLYLCFALYINLSWSPFFRRKVAAIEYSYSLQRPASTSPPAS